MLTARKTSRNNHSRFLPNEFSQFTKNTELGLCLLNRRFEILWANKTQTRWFGPLKKICGKHCYETFEHKQKICYGCPVLRTFKNGKPAHSEPRVAFTQDGRIKFYELSTSPIRDGHGRVKEVLEIVRDITSRKMFEDEHLRLLAALDAASDFICITSLKGKVLYVNDAFTSKGGFSRSDLLEKNIGVLIANDNPPDFIKNILDRTLDENEWKGEGWITKKDGTKIRGGIATSLVRDKDGRPIAIVGISRDMSKEKEQSRRLKLLIKRLWKTNKVIKENAIKFNEANQKIQLLNKSLEAKVHERAKELELANEEIMTLYTLGRKMVSSLSLQEVLDVIVKSVSMMMSVEAASVRLFDEKNMALLLTASCGLSNEYQEQCKFMNAESSITDIIENRLPLIVANIPQDNTVPFQPNLLKEGFNSLVVVPIVFNDEVLGLINAFSRARRVFIDSEVDLLQAVASQAAIAIKNAKLHENVHLNYYNTINTLSLALEARDPYTRGHAERVTNYAIGIAKVLKLSKEDIHILKYSGKIHDIGKIAVSDLILLKPGKLTPSEKAQVELHSIKGVEIISNLKFLEPGIPIIKHHHERYDGMGYPDGLREEEIPIGARILAVADAFDAMTSERPYRSALTFEEAVEDLKQNSGRQFDPYIVDAFLRILTQRLPR